MIDPALTDEERNAKTAHLSVVIQEEERKRDAYRVCFSSFSLIEFVPFFHRLKIYVDDIIGCLLLSN